MKRNSIVFLILSCFVFAGANAQTQLDNASFEEWESIDVGPVPEPVNWSSVRTAIPDNLAKLAPAVWGQSTDAHSGNYSVYLVNVSTLSIVATGSLTCGRLFASPIPSKGYTFTDVNNPDFNMPLTHRPDSITGWYKCNPKPGDFPTVKLILHTDSANFPTTDSSNWIGYSFNTLSTTPVEEWTRFSFPIHYLNEGNPEYILMMLTAGNGTNAIAESEAWFDDLELIYNDGTGINEVTEDDLFVTCTQKTLTVYVKDNRPGNMHLQVVDRTGRTVLTAQTTTGKRQSFQMNVPTGIYFLVVHLDNRTLTRKIFVR